MGILSLFWIQAVFIVTGFLALQLGFISFFSPKLSIYIYQTMMAWFNWRVEPIDESKELSRTKAFGFILIVLGFIIVFLAFKMKF